MKRAFTAVLSVVIVAAFVASLAVQFRGYAPSVRPVRPSVSNVYHAPVVGHGVTTSTVSESADGLTYTCTETVAGGQVYINDCNAEG